MKTIITKPIFDIFAKSKKTMQKEKEIAQKQKITIDYREKNSLVASHLARLGFEIEFRELKVGDYAVNDVIIERKSVSDFISSMLNKRLLKQLEELKQFEKKLLIIEGISEQELYSDDENEFKINPNAIRGFLLSIALRHKIPLLFTKNSEDTARFISVLAKKSENNEIGLKAKKKTLNKKEQLQFIVEGFPGIGPKKAKELLKKFGTIQNIINAPIEELKEILGKKADIITEIINRKY